MTARRWRILLVAVVVVVIGAAFMVSQFASGHPEPAAYRLPWEAGQAGRYKVIQGNFTADLSGSCVSGCATHSDEGMHFAWDFDLPEGTEVVAARGGTVGLVAGSWSPGHCGGLVAVDNPPPGYLIDPLMGNQANLVTIDHGDGTSALYLHLSAVSTAIERKAKTGERVVQGEVLGRSGKTGLTRCVPHLHFQVEETVRADWFTPSLPVRFADQDVVSRTADGVPVQGESYLSSNLLVCPPGDHHRAGLAPTPTVANAAWISGGNCVQ